MTELPRQSDPGPPIDMLSLAADDEVVTALAAGREVDDDALTTLLSRFRSELDDAYSAGALAAAPIPVPAMGRGRRLRRGAAVGVVTVAVAASLTGVAAAVGGDANPLHRALTSLVDSRPDPSFREAQQMLRQAERMAEPARERGWIGDADRATVLSLVDRVVVLAADADSDGGQRRSLAARVAALRGQIAALPPAPDAAADEPTAGPEPGDDHGTDGASPTPEATTEDGGSHDGGGSDGGSDSTSGSAPTSGSGSDEHAGSTDSGGNSGSDGGTDGAGSSGSQSDSGSSVISGTDSSHEVSGFSGSDGSGSSDGSEDGSHSG